MLLQVHVSFFSDVHTDTYNPIKLTSMVWNTQNCTSCSPLYCTHYQIHGPMGSLIPFINLNTQVLEEQKKYIFNFPWLQNKQLWHVLHWLQICGYLCHRHLLVMFVVIVRPDVIIFRLDAACHLSGQHRHCCQVDIVTIVRSTLSPVEQSFLTITSLSLTTPKLMLLPTFNSFSSQLVSFFQQNPLESDCQICIIFQRLKKCLFTSCFATNLPTYNTSAP